MSKKILVIAFKFNDILYASSAKEFIDAEDRHILIFENNSANNNFPLLDEFSLVLRLKLHVNKLYLLLKLVWEINFGKLKHNYSFVFLSNPFLIITKYIMSAIKVKEIILVEDGAMNYYDFKENRALLKRSIEYIFGLKHVLSLIKKTYLLRPQAAMCFYGEKKYISTSVFNKIRPPNFLLELLHGKKILLGGGPIELIAKELKFYIIKKVIKKYNIDLYIPHHSFCDSIGALQSIHLSDHGVTFECIAPLIKNASLYTFGSTVVLNTCVLNNDLKTVLLKFHESNYIDKFGFYKLMEDSVDTVVHLDSFGDNV